MREAFKIIVMKTDYFDYSKNEPKKKQKRF